MAKILALLFILAFLGLLCPGQATIPEPYYVNATWNDHSLHGLKTLIGDHFTVPYQVGTFDCGEMSAYLEWLLQCHGFEAGFCMDGTGPWVIAKDAGYSTHMWVTAELHNDTTGAFTGRVYIESTATPIHVISWGDPEWGRYARPQSTMFLGMKHFLTIYDVLSGFTSNPDDSNSVHLAESEIDWWVYGMNLTTPASSYRGITEQDIINLRKQVAAKKEYGTFRTK